MKTFEIMVAKVVMIDPNASVRDVANFLLNNHISAFPVVSEDGNLLRIVSEGDLMRRVEIGTERHRSWWLEMLSSDEARAAEFVKANARKVGDVMTRNAITANPETQIRDIASLMERSNIKRVPIEKIGKVVGIVSRANLFQALASASLVVGAQQGQYIGRGAPAERLAFQ